ncbi:MAG TPA: hypothetical protein PK402_01410 [Tepidisphaeraceae bacterium]|nr:hypothetical protein [Tepidisphaeraceae bacterium]
MTSCAPKNALESGQSSALDQIDLISMTDQMAMSLGNDPGVIKLFQQHGPLLVVVQPVENRLTAEVLPRGPSQLFTARVRTQLERNHSSMFIWINNRDTFYSLRDQELEGIEPGPSPDAINPEYALTATFSSITQEDSKHRSIYYLCTFDLSSLSDRTRIWSDSYDVKKIAMKGFLD